MVFAGNIPGETRSIPLAVYSALQVPGGENTAMILVGFSIILSLAALIFSNILQKYAQKGPSQKPQPGQCLDPEDQEGFGGAYES
jgi:molybdate transport system permease protein